MTYATTRDQNKMTNTSPCSTCPFSDSGFCGAVLHAADSSTLDKTESWQDHRVFAAGKQALSQDQTYPDVFVMCSGWGIRFIQLPDGGKQILNFLLPGDLFSVGLVFEGRVHFSVKALTAIQISGLRRAQVLRRVAGNPEVLAALTRSCLAESEASDRMIASLGRGSAEQRIAHLFLHLTKRIAAHNVIRDHRYPFPLLQQHIADAVGLTPVHVSRVLGAIRDSGIAELSNGVLEVHDIHRLQQLGFPA